MSLIIRISKKQCMQMAQNAFDVPVIQLAHKANIF